MGTATDGVALWGELTDKYGDGPKTAVAETGGGGHHVFFALPAAERGIDSRNQQPMVIDGEKIQGIDVRGTGGYIVAPPSMQS